MTLKKIRKALVALIFLVLAGFSGWWVRGEYSQVELSVPARKEEIDFLLFWDVWARLERDFIKKEEIEPQKMYFGAIEGMVSSLEDPYTVFLAPEENKRAKQDLNGDFEGVGIQIGFKQRRLVVIAPLNNTPAQRAGVKAGDLILRIEDEEKGIDRETMGISLPEAVELIRGPKGSSVILTLQSADDDKPRRVTIVRAMIIVPSVEVEFKEGVVYLELSRFGDKTQKEWQEAIGKIKKRCLPQNDECLGVVLDLRNNPGGYLSGSVFIASEFLESGVVVYQEGKGDKEVYEVEHPGDLTKTPLVVLINGGSASASEIVAGALKVHQRAVIVGERSFGKGTIQEAQELPGGAGLHVTTARWLLPNEEAIDEEGLEPDYLIENPEDSEEDLQLEKAIELLVNI